MNYLSMSGEELKEEREKLLSQFEKYKKKELKLDMSRGKPCVEQLDISEDMLKTISCNEDCFTKKGFDCRNYGLVDGLDSAKELFGEILGIAAGQIIVGGNSSLNLMYDAVTRCLLYGVVGGTGPWIKADSVKFLCPVPGYDRHFGICQSLGIEMVNVPMTKDGPDMDIVEELVKDKAVKGIWCVPKYSNPDGITYSDETVRRFANLKPASPDFRIFWDNAYCVHDLNDDGDVLLNILDECEKAKNPNLPFVFTSTSKITYPGSGVSVVGASKENIAQIKSIMQMQTIGHDKMNMLRHMKYFGSADGMKTYMKKHAEILRPKFELVLNELEKEFKDNEIAQWKSPKGGYFISFNVLSGCAKKTVQLAKDLGVVLTEAGATFPYKIDPNDTNIRIAPTFPPVSELKSAIEVLCLCTKLSCTEKLLEIS